MIKIYFSILLGFLFLKIQAQTYIPMFENGKIWNMTYETWTVGIPNSTVTTNYGNFIDGVTTLNGTVYYVLRDSRNTNVNYLREDLTNKKIYLLDTSNNTEKLLYDFNVQVGDVFNADKLNTLFTASERTVVAIGTEMKFGINTKVYTLASTNNSNCIKVYEGVGFSPEGLTNDPIWCSTFDPSERYTLTNINQTLTIDDYFTKSNIYLSYNTDTKQLKINHLNNFFQLEMYSILGQKVLDTQLKGTLNIPQLKKGLYFYTLSQSNFQKKGKILIY